MQREIEKLKEVFRRVKYKGKREIWELVLSYWQDCLYFYNNGNILFAFELVNYIWGMLDILANLNMLEIPEDIKKWFKV